jgi:DNA gyrase inhibitor GyrI
MNLTETPKDYQWPVTHYVFVERIGPFQETAMDAWQTFHKYKDQIAQTSKITGAFSQYKIKPQMIYRAGVAVEAKPEKLPEGFKYERFEGGKYACFTLTGPYSNLPEACGRVFGIVEKTGMKVRDGYFLENYVNDPTTTPEDKLITEILIPT